MGNRNCGACYNRGCWQCSPEIRAANQYADSAKSLEDRISTLEQGVLSLTRIVEGFTRLLEAKK